MYFKIHEIKTCAFVEKKTCFISLYHFHFILCKKFFFCVFSSFFQFSAAAADKKLPVLVFLHGESFEFNSGNPYDGTVLASYGEMVVVTLNYRLGILGMFKKKEKNEFTLFCSVAFVKWLILNFDDIDFN